MNLTLEDEYLLLPIYSHTEDLIAVAIPAPEEAGGGSFDSRSMQALDNLATAALTLSRTLGMSVEELVGFVKHVDAETPWEQDNSAILDLLMAD